MTLIHATALALGNKGVLIQGPPGSGKSDLALRCIARAPSSLIHSQAHLIADDQVQLTLHDGAIVLSAPPAILGQLEVRGLGIITLTPIPTATLALIITLLPPNAAPERLPEPQTMLLLGQEVPVLALQPFDASAPLKALLALQSA